MTALSGRRILVVEDEPIIAMTIEDILDELGCTVVGPATGLAEALRLAEDGEFDAAILDINLNGERSYAIASVLRRRGIPYLFATGYGSAGIEGEPAAKVIEKPFHSHHVGSALTAILGES